MSTRHLPRIARSVFLFAASAYLVSCQGISDIPTTPQIPPTNPNFTGVPMWKGDSSEVGLYSHETILTPTTVTATNFGRWGSFQADGIIMGQPLYVSQLDMGTAGTHNVIIFGTENDSVYAIDADNPTAAAFWQRSYIDPDNGVTTLPEIFGGRTTLGGQVGITGTPYIDFQPGCLLCNDVLSRNGVAEQWLRAIDIRTGNDFGPGSVKIQASVPGDGKASVNGQIAFDPSIQNQRAGIYKANGQSLLPGDRFPIGASITGG